MSKLVSGTGMKWFEIDISYLKHPVCKSLRKGSQKWKKFLCKLGVSDFVRIVEVKKGVWDSQELTHLLSHVSSNGDKEKIKMVSKTFLLLALAFAAVILITSDVTAAKDLASNHDGK
ncbi:hypothetical protein Tco_1510280 [Tanacetum coccineum]